MKNLSPLQPVDKNNPIVFFDINIGLEKFGRLIIELRKDVVPKTAENFRALCTGENGIGTMGKPLHYKGVRFHKIMKYYVALGGDIINNNGTSGESIYGPIFDDENFTLQHLTGGVVSMANYGQPNTNNSQFIITSGPCENLNGTNVIVGQVLRGLPMLQDMERNADTNGSPIEDIIIVDCGEIIYTDNWGVNDNDGTADNLPNYPEDWVCKYYEFSIDQFVNILNNIRDAGNDFFNQNNIYEARRKYRKGYRYYNFIRHYFEQAKPNLFHIEESLKELDKCAARNNNNMAAVELKLMNYNNVCEWATEALRLNPLCHKALYRRGQAHIALSNYENAIEDLEMAYKLLPKNKQIFEQLNRAKQLSANYINNQREKLQKLF